MSKSIFVTCLKWAGGAAMLAGLIAMGLPGAGGASAREMTHCQIKHSFCTERCLMRGLHPEQENMCLKRTCDHQFQNCTRDSEESSTTSYEGVKPPRGVKPIRPGGRPGRGLLTQNPGRPGIDIDGDILGSSPWLPTRGPAATGAPVNAPAAPAAPPVIIR